MNDSRTTTISDSLNHENSRTDSSWYPPASFSIISEDESIFLVNKITVARHKQTSQTFSLAPVSVEESLALSAWDESINIEGNSIDKNSNLEFSTDINRVNTCNDDAVSVTTYSTYSTTTTTSSSYPSEINISLADLIKYNNKMTTPVISQSKQIIVNPKDEVVESAESLEDSVDLLPLSSISDDSSTIKDGYSLYQEKLSIASISFQLSRVLENAKHDKQRMLRGWVKCLWPQPRLPNAKYLASRLNARSLSRRNLNPLTVGVITVKKRSVQMISTIIVKGTKHSSDGIEENGKIKFAGEPTVITGVYDPREYLLLHCPTYHNPPYCNNDPRAPWTEKFLLDKVLPKLTKEVNRIQDRVGLYLTVKETLLRGLGQCLLYECNKCALGYGRTFTYDGIQRHLASNKHGVKIVSDEDMIKINLRAYITAFYKNLPPKIVSEQ